jgi:glycosyltransferase involved in cell wall biosynthesis
MITFIIPSLNRPTLKNTIQSLLNQTKNDWKAIIIYDGVDGQLFDDNRIRTYKVDKIGGFSDYHGIAGLVRNYGIEKCDTEWIGFLDDDDTIDSKYVETLQKKYLKYDFVVWRMKYTDGMVIPRLSNENLFFGNVGISFCYKNKFENLKFENNRDGEDFDFISKLRKSTSNYVITPEIFYNVNH